MTNDMTFHSIDKNDDDFTHVQSTLFNSLEDPLKEMCKNAFQTMKEEITTIHTKVVHLIPKLQSKDQLEYSMAMMDIIECVSNYIEMMESHDATESLASSVCQIVQVILGGQKNSFHEDILNTVNSCIRTMDNDLKHSFQKTYEKMHSNRIMLDKYFKDTTMMKKQPLSSNAEDDWTSLDAYYTFGLDCFLETILHLIHNHNNDDQTTFQLIGCYLKLSYLRRVQMFQLSILYNANNNYVIGKDIVKRMRARQQIDFNHFQWWLEPPNKNNCSWYAKMVLDRETKTFADLMIGTNDDSKVVRIYSTEINNSKHRHGGCLEVSSTIINHEPKHRLLVNTEGETSQFFRDESLFMIFRADNNASSEELGRIQIFSLSAGGYVLCEKSEIYVSNEFDSVIRQSIWMCQKTKNHYCLFWKTQQPVYYNFIHESTQTYLCLESVHADIDDRNKSKNRSAWMIVSKSNTEFKGPQNTSSSSWLSTQWNKMRKRVNSFFQKTASGLFQQFVEALVAIFVLSVLFVFLIGFLNIQALMVILANRFIPFGAWMISYLIRFVISVVEFLVIATCYEISKVAIQQTGAKMDPFMTCFWLFVFGIISLETLDLCQVPFRFHDPIIVIIAILSQIIFFSNYILYKMKKKTSQ